MFCFAFRKASDRPSAARRLTDYNRPDLKRIDNLEPSTEYVIEAWTNVADSQGRLIATSEKINTTVFTGNFENALFFQNLRRLISFYVVIRFVNRISVHSTNILTET